MHIREYQETDVERLFAYWRLVGRLVPYFFQVGREHWRTCLLEDRLDGERTFPAIQTCIALEEDKLLGFVQYGRPRFIWNSSGRQANSQTAVIRHLFYGEGRREVGEALLARAEDSLGQYPQNHAFYHILGMSCNAYHGKLHSSQPHVERLLLRHGFAVEHENAYYVLDMAEQGPGDGGLDIGRRSVGEGLAAFEARLSGELVGTAEVRYLDILTAGGTRDVAYLTWIGVEEGYRGRGLGSRFMASLTAHLRGQGYRYLHTDTAHDNEVAQRYYDRTGFRREGFTRSYVRESQSGR